MSVSRTTSNRTPAEYNSEILPTEPACSLFTQNSLPWRLSSWWGFLAECLFLSSQLDQYRREKGSLDNGGSHIQLKETCLVLLPLTLCHSLRSDMRKVWKSRQFNTITLVNGQIVLLAIFRKIFHSLSLDTPNSSTVHKHILLIPKTAFIL
jgi:hypothetical protein